MIPAHDASQLPSFAQVRAHQSSFHIAHRNWNKFRGVWTINFILVIVCRVFSCLHSSKQKLTKRGSCESCSTNYCRELRIRLFAFLRMMHVVEKTGADIGRIRKF